VQDTGSGIYPAVLKRIFDPFFTTKKMAGGSGLGLSVLHGIIHSAGGHVCVSSKPGQGTEFGVFFPATSSVSVPALAPPEVVRHQRDRHIMLVDDEPGIVSYLKDLLEASGYRVSCFTEASVALCQFQANPADVDLLITDQEMEELNGVDLVRAMHILRPDLPVVMCTGYSRDIDEKVANGLGVAHFLVKPIPGNVMLQAISSCLSTGRA
jgi:CheY-like chemotaxis protein